MSTEGPQLEALLRRLSDTPAEFLAPPRIGNTGQIAAVAVINDLHQDLGGSSLSPDQIALFEKEQDANALTVMLVAAWLLHDDWFCRAGAYAEQAVRFLTDDARGLSVLTKAPAFAADPDRQEELIRLALRALDLRPRGESEALAQDRLSTVSSSERLRVIEAARTAEARAREIREALARKAAEEAAAKYNRE